MTVHTEDREVQLACMTAEERFPLLTDDELLDEAWSLECMYQCVSFDEDTWKSWWRDAQAYVRELEARDLEIPFEIFMPCEDSFDMVIDENLADYGWGC